MSEYCENCYKLQEKLDIATKMLEKILLDVRFADVEIHAKQALELINEG